MAGVLCASFLTVLRLVTPALGYMYGERPRTPPEDEGHEAEYISRYLSPSVAIRRQQQSDLASTIPAPLSDRIICRTPNDTRHQI